MYMILSKKQFNNLPNEYKQYFEEIGGDASSGGKNIHPT